MKNLKSKQGISLIVLIITIIVIIILATAVIQSFSNNNPIEKAKEAKFKNDVKAMQEELELSKLNLYFDESEDITIDSLKSASNYKEKFAVTEGELKYKKDAGLTEEEIKWAEELGVTINAYVLKNGEYGVTIKNGVLTTNWYDHETHTSTIPSEMPNEVAISNKVTSIGDYAFASTYLKILKIPNSVTSIGISAFECCNLGTIRLSDFKSIGEFAFRGSDIDTLILNQSGVQEQLFYAGFINKLVFENGLTSVSGIRSNDISIHEVALPNTLERIESEAFYQYYLSEIKIPENVTYIGSWALSANSFTSITIPSKVESIGEDALTSCYSLREIIIQGEPRFTRAQVAEWLGSDDMSNITISGSGYISE